MKDQHDIDDDGGKKKKKRDKSVFREYFELIAETAVFVFFVMTFVVQAFQIPTGSMEPTLLVGDFLLVNKLIYTNTDNPIDKLVLPRRQVRRQDIVIFKYPNELNKDFVKRVIGLPGETVEVHDGRVFIDGQPLDEPYLPTLFMRDYGPAQVPPEYIFVMGDNRGASNDSRIFGPVSQDSIVGRAWVSYWPPDQIGLLK